MYNLPRFAPGINRQGAIVPVIPTTLNNVVVQYAIDAPPLNLSTRQYTVGLRTTALFNSEYTEQLPTKQRTVGLRTTALFDLPWVKATSAEQQVHLMTVQVLSGAPVPLPASDQRIQLMSVQVLVKV